MTKEEFRKLFESALEVAAKNAETKLGSSVARRFEIELHGLAPHPRLREKDEAFEAIYLGTDRFYRIIDLVVSRVSKDTSTVFMSISGHPPGPLNQTWNEPSGSGPFKQVLADKVELV